jgi:hypothetical protein
MAEAKGDRLITSIAALLTSSATGALLGLIFWAVAARLYPAPSVGEGAAAIAAMMLLASLAQLNLSVLFPRFLYPSGARAIWVLLLGYGASTLVAVAVGAIFLTLTGHHPFIGRGELPPFLFVVAVVLWVVFTIEDAALIGLRATFWVPVENTSFSLAKIALLPVLAAVVPASGVFYSWTLPVVACIIPVNYYLFRKVLPAHIAASAGHGSLPTAPVVGAVLGGENLGNLAFIALTTLPALLIVAKLGATQTAYFQTPWLIGTSFDFLLYGIATSLLVESSARPSIAPTLVSRAVRLGCLLLIPGCLVLLIGAPLILSVLGDGYAANGTSLLRWLALALPFMGVNVLYLTFARMGRRVRRIVAVQVGLAVVILILTELLIGHMGIAGAGVAFATGQALVACIVLPSVVRQYRRAGMAPGFAPEGSLVVRETTQAKEVNDVAEADPEDATTPASLGRDVVTPAPLPGHTETRAQADQPTGSDVRGAVPRQRHSWRAIVTATVLAVDILALYTAVTNVQGTMRVILGLAMVLVVPGWSVIGLVRLADPALEVALTVAVSLASYIIAAQILLTFNAWNLSALQKISCVVWIPFLMWQLLVPPKRPG